jgi:hypothetical protein
MRAVYFAARAAYRVNAGPDSRDRDRAWGGVRGGVMQGKRRSHGFLTQCKHMNA